MKAKWMLILTAAIGFGAMAIYQTVAAEGAADTKAAIGKAAPDFTLPDAYGKAFSLSEFKGKIVVLEWINQHCPVSHRCHRQKLMQSLYSKYAKQGVVWLAIDTTAGAEPEKNRIYAAQQTLAYPILHDKDGKVGRRYEARTTPHMFVIDKSGTLVYAGALDDDLKGGNPEKTDYVEAAIEAVKAGKPVAKARTKSYGCPVKYAPKRSGQRSGS